MFHQKGPTLLELAHQAFSSTTRGYDLLAPKFEYTPFRTPDLIVEAMMRELGQEKPVLSGLDLCCGTGALLRGMHPLCKERVVGIDLSAGMLKEARRLSEHSSHGDAAVEFLQMNAMEMDFYQEFDLAGSCGAFGHILHPDQDRFVDRIRRALRPGGRFVFVTRPMPSIQESVWWKSRGFNAAMHVRNAVFKPVLPPFVMFYLTFTLERACEVLLRHGFSLEARASFEGRLRDFRVVIATKR